MSASIVIMTGSHLCHNPRVIKEGTALAKAGYDVCSLGAWFDPVLKERDKKLMGSLQFKFFPVIDSVDDTTRRVGLRLRRKLATIARHITHIDNRWQLGYAYPALRRAAFHRKADIYIAHSEQAMAVGLDLLRNGRRVGLDMEDWFSEDLLPEMRKRRPVRLLRFLESELLTHGAYASCTSHTMSKVLAEEYQCARPVVIYNAFQWSERMLLANTVKDRRNRYVPSIHWFSQTVGLGRGLEDLFAALPLIVHPAEVHLRGNLKESFKAWLLGRVPESWRDRIFFHDLVSNEELPSRIAEHDIGFAGEMTYCRSRDLTITNKILQYILGGLAVVASDTAGQREVSEQAKDAVLLYPPGDYVALANQLNALIGSPGRMKQAKTGALRAAEEIFCWERQEKILLETVTKALAK